MKTAKRFLTAALAVLFTLMCALPALADETPAATQTYTLTIDNPAAGHTYEVYQIFAGHHTQDGDKEYLSDIEWGSGIKTDNDSRNAMIVELKKANLYDKHTAYVDGVNDATKVAMALSKLKDKAEEVDKFNEIVGAYLGMAINTKQADGTAPIQFTLPAGYYLVKDQNGSVGENESYTKYLVKLVADATMNIKSQSMSLEKHILTGNQKVTANNAAMGDTVNYCLESQLSEMDGYDTYTFIVHDELDAGLTFNENVAVQIGNTEDSLADYAGKTVEYAMQKDGNYSSKLPTIEKGQKLYIRITLKGLTRQYKGQLVLITYSATVNEKANIGNTPNTNAAYLEYSNNPNASQQGGQTSTTVTPKTTVSTYVAGIQISKVSPKDSLLPGAQFKIEAKGDTNTDAINQLNVTGYSFAEAGENDVENYYYKEGDSFVTVAPDAQAQKYVAKGGTNLNNGSSIVGMTGDGNNTTQPGILRFDGLKAGTYTITEVLAPTGYKKLNDPIVVEITFAENDDHDGYHWSYVVTGGTKGDIALGDVNDGVQSFKIVNQHGLTLPFTGGAGANQLAGVGLALMAATAAAILYIKHRKDRE